MEKNNHGIIDSKWNLKIISFKLKIHKIVN